MSTPVRIAAPLQGTVVAIAVEVGDLVRQGDELLLLEAMKMQHPVVAAADGRVAELRVSVGQLVDAGDVLVCLRPDAASAKRIERPPAPMRSTAVRDDLAEVLARREAGNDAARSGAVTKRHALGLRTARENLDDLCDAGSFVEYGPTVVAAQRSRRPMQELQRDTAADGLIGGGATVDRKSTRLNSS